MTSQLQIQYRPTDSIRGYERNARVHTQDQIGQIIDSIAEFGFNNPILIDEHGVIIAGHGRLEAAKQMTLAEVPTITIAGLSDEQRRAYVIADNKIALNARWDETLLAAELQMLQLSTFDMKLTGFSELEIATRLDEPVDHRDEWNDMPEFNNQNLMAFRKLIVNFQDEDAIKDFVAKLGIELADTSKFIWYPDVEEDKTTDERVVGNAT